MELNRETMKKILDGIDLKEAPPTEEPARQYYFMASARKRLADRFAAELSTGEGPPGATGRRSFPACRRRAFAVRQR